MPWAGSGAVEQATEIVIFFAVTCGMLPAGLASPRRETGKDRIGGIDDTRDDAGSVVNE